jgi:ABC-type nitrate/sulfonate/bicarbonate transport system substrate-binding protein
VVSSWLRSRAGADGVGPAGPAVAAGRVLAELVLPGLVVSGLVMIGLAGCRSPERTPSGSTTQASTTQASSTASSTGSGTNATGAPGVAGVPIDPARCERNRAVGPVRVRIGSDGLGAAGSIEWAVALQRGYFEQLCLDVELVLSPSVPSFALVATGLAEFSSASSFTELVRNSTPEQALTAVYIAGRAPAEVLVVETSQTGSTSPAPGRLDAEALRGTVIGVSGDLPPSIQVMLAQAGLTRDLDYSVAEQQPGPVTFDKGEAVAMPRFEAERLDSGTTAMLDPLDVGVSGSFGVVYTSASFAKDHPEATADLARAALRGFADAVADPEGAVQVAFAATNQSADAATSGTQLARWKSEAKLIVELTPSGVGWGQIDVGALDAEVTEYIAAGIFPVKPDVTEAFISGLVESISTADGQIIFPS